MQCPAGAAYLWEWFIELSNARVSGEAVGFRELVAWQELKRITLRAWELDAIRNLDIAYLRPDSKKKQGE